MVGPPLKLHLAADLEKSIYPIELKTYQSDLWESSGYFIFYISISFFLATESSFRFGDKCPIFAKNGPKTHNLDRPTLKWVDRSILMVNSNLHPNLALSVHCGRKNNLSSTNKKSQQITYTVPPLATKISKMAKIA